MGLMDRIRDLFRGKPDDSPVQMLMDGEMSVRDRVAPDAYEEHPSYVQIGERFVRYVCMRDVATGANLGSDLMFAGGIPELWAAMHLIPLPPSEMAAALRRAETEEASLEIYNARRGRLGSPEREARLATLRAARQEVEVFGRPIYRMSVVYGVSGRTRDEMEQRCAQLMEWARAHQMQLMTGRYVQRSLEHSLLGPLRVPVFRNVFASTLRHTMPFRVRTYFESPGLFYGIHSRTGSLVVLDPFRRINPSHLVLGIQGSGKSVFLKMLTMMIPLLQLGRVVVLDPEREYEQIITQALGGEYVVLKQQGLNILGVRAGETWEEWRERALVLIKGFMAIALGRALDPVEAQTIIPVSFLRLSELSRERVEQGQSPTLDDFQRVLEAEGHTELARLLIPYTHPDLWGQFFSAHTTLDLSNPVIGVSLDKSIPEDMIAPFVWAVMAQVWQRMSPGEPTFLIVDESWYLFRNPGVAMMLDEAARRFPKRSGALILATHRVEDLLDARIRTVATTAGNVLLFPMTRDMARGVGAVFGLRDFEIEALSGWSPGMGLLLADGGNIRIPLYVTVPGPWQQMMFVRGRSYIERVGSGSAFA